jgi:hypothetical protein
MLSNRFARAWSLGPVVLLVACDTSYGLPPTQCDDHCHAIQRGVCDDDDPADCVRDCESENGDAAHQACDDSRLALDDCWLRLDASAFECIDNHTRLPDLCLDERRAFSECLEPGSSPCFDQCLRQVHTCGGVLADCEFSCQHPSPGCASVTFAYQACLLRYPAECRSWGEPETRAPEDVPCFDEALAVLACAN